jgi:two-component system sensor histidine kinase KdpD
MLMTSEKKVLPILMAITHISNDHRMAFEEKMQQLLMQVLACMEASRGSIMLMKGSHQLEIVASTNPDIIGTKQPIDGSSPSGWVVRNKVPLYVDKKTGQRFQLDRSRHYKKSAFLIVPIMRGTNIIGVISVTDKVGKDAFQEEEQKILLQITGQVIGTLEMERLAASLKKSKKSLSNKNHKLKKLEKLRTDLFNMLIHDLKGPISEIMANLDILSYTIDDDNRPFVETAQTGCDTLERMVSNLLDIARLEEGKLPLIIEKINPQDLMKEAVGRICRLAEMKKLTFEQVCPSKDNACYLAADKGLMLRVLQNMLTNALQYSPEGETVQLGYSYENASRIRFFVKDRGPGVPSEFKKAVFDKFMQLEKKADGRIYSTGLGLTFCKLALKAHHGKIGVEKNPPKGSHFWFSLPLAPQTA